MLIYISKDTTKEIRKKFYQFRQFYNEQKTKLIPKADGKGLYNALLKEQIRQPHEAAFKVLLNKYICTYNDIFIKFREHLTDLPSLRITRKEFARLLNCSERVTYDYIQRLEEAGCILQRSRGSQLSFEVWISPYLLFTVEFVEKILKSSKASNFKNLRGFLQTLPQVEDQSNLFNINSNVDLLGTETDKSKGVETTKDSKGIETIKNTFKPETGHVQTENQEKKPLVTKKVSSKHSKKQPAGADEKRQQINQYFKGHVVTLWLYIKQMLYPHISINEEQERIIKNQLLTLCVNEYNSQVINLILRNEKADYKRIDKYFELCQTRINMVKVHVQKNPTRFIPIPQKWLDVSFNKGFTGTLAWYTNNLTLKAKVQADQLLNEGIRAMQTGKMKGKGQKTRLQIYQYYKENLQKLSSEQQYNAFLNFCANTKFN